MTTLDKLKAWVWFIAIVASTLSYITSVWLTMLVDDFVVWNQLIWLGITIVFLAIRPENPK